MAEAREVRIRKAGEEDIPELALLLEELFSLEEDFEVNKNLQREGLELMIHGGKNCVLIAECKGVIAGMCTLQVIISTAEGGPVGLVEDVIVSAPFRGRGIGTILLKALEEMAAGLGLKRLQLLTDRGNDSALHFYARNAWQPTQLICLRKKETGNYNVRDNI